MLKQKGICEECKKEYEYEYNPKYPRKYCSECSAKKKAEYENKQLPTEDKVEVVKPGIPNHTTMYVSYAKDIFCELMKEQGFKDTPELSMSQAIELVKQARREFE